MPEVGENTSFEAPRKQAASAWKIGKWPWLAAAAGVMIAVSTDSHSTGELELVRCGLDQARRAGLQKSDILNSLPWNRLQRLFHR
jgi:hypothetical protein